MKKILIIAVVVGSVSAGGYFLAIRQSENLSNNDESVAHAATIFKSPSCGCCVGFAGELKMSDFQVDVINTNDMVHVKEEHDIPHNMQSCHTTVIGDYFIEGHVPIEAVQKLLEERPAIDGIALPGMPGGSPGMPGVKREPFVIYQITGGVPSEYMSI